MSSSEYEARTESRERAHHSAVRQLAITRKNAKQMVLKTEDEVAPLQCIANPNPPTEQSIHGIERYQQPTWAELLAKLHAATLAYWSEVRPYRQYASEFWEQTLLDAVEYPVPGEMRAEGSRYGLPTHYQTLDWQTVSVTLDSLGAWRYREVELKCRIEKRHGDDKIRTRREKVYLPRAAAVEAVEALDDLLQDIGLLAEVREPSAEDYDPGKPDHWGGGPDG